MTRKNIFIADIECPIRSSAMMNAPVLEIAAPGTQYDVLVIIDVSVREQWVKVLHSYLIEAYVCVKSTHGIFGSISTVPVATGSLDRYNRGYIDARKFSLLQMRAWCNDELRKIDGN